MTTERSLVASRIRTFNSLSSEQAPQQVETLHSVNRPNNAVAGSPPRGAKPSKSSASLVSSYRRKQPPACATKQSHRKRTKEECNGKTASRSDVWLPGRRNRDRDDRDVDPMARRTPLITVTSSTGDDPATSEDTCAAEKPCGRFSRNDPVCRCEMKYPHSNWAGCDPLKLSSHYKQLPIQRSGSPRVSRPASTILTPERLNSLSLASPDFRRIPLRSYPRTETIPPTSTSGSHDGDQIHHRPGGYHKILDTLQDIQSILFTQSKTLESLQTTLLCIADLSQSVVELSATLREQIKYTVSDTQTLGTDRPEGFGLPPNFVRPEDSCSQVSCQLHNHPKLPKSEGKHCEPSIQDVAVMLDEAVDEMCFLPTNTFVSSHDPGDILGLQKDALGPWLDAPRAGDGFMHETKLSTVVDDMGQLPYFSEDHNNSDPTRHRIVRSRLSGTSRKRCSSEIEPNLVMPGHFPGTPDAFSPSLEVPFLPNPGGYSEGLREDEASLSCLTGSAATVRPKSALRPSSSVKHSREPVSLASMLAEPQNQVISTSTVTVERGRPRLRDMNSLGSSSSRFTSSSRLLVSRRPFRS